MSPTRLTGYVTVPRDAEFVTLKPGDDLPDWATDIVTNPEILEEYGAPAAAPTAPAAPATPPAAPATPAPAAPVDRKAIQDRAKALEVKANGTNEEILARIAAKEAELAPPAAPAADADADDDDSLDLGALRAKAKELGLEFTDETSEAELVLLIQSKE